LNGYENEVVRELRRDPRQRLSGIASKLGMSRQTAMRALKRAEAKMLKYTTLPDFKALGFEVHALMLFHPKSRRLLSFLKKSRNTNSLAVSSGRFAVMATAIFRNMGAYYEFEEQAARLCSSKRTHFIVEEVKQEDAGC